jgi:hypothetical protein
VSTAAQARPLFPQNRVATKNSLTKYG